jgi:hypothetical protein
MGAVLEPPRLERHPPMRVGEAAQRDGEGAADAGLACGNPLSEPSKGGGGDLADDLNTSSKLPPAGSENAIDCKNDIECDVRAFVKAGIAPATRRWSPARCADSVS